MQDLRISLIQTDLAWEKPAENRVLLSEKLAPLAGNTDLVVLPEMFPTGFSMNAADLAEPSDGPTLAWLRQQAAVLDAVVTGSYIAEEDGFFFNRLAWVFPDGTSKYYDKKHLFTLAGEHHHYTAGAERLIVSYLGWRICPLICYDLRFPVWSRNTENFDLLLYVANWPDRRRQAWRHLLAARAIENQVYTAGVNRVGLDGNEIYYSGDSSLIDFAGEQHFHCAHREAVFTATLSYSEQQTFRRKLPFLNDRDLFSFV